MRILMIVALGLLVGGCFMTSPPVVVSDFCAKTKAQLRNFKLTPAESAALSATNARKLLALKRKYKEGCP